MIKTKFATSPVFEQTKQDRQSMKLPSVDRKQSSSLEKRDGVVVTVISGVATSIRKQRTSNVAATRLGAMLASLMVIALALLSGGPVLAAGPDTNPFTAWDNRLNYFERFPAARQHGVFHPQHNPDGKDVVNDQKSEGPGSVKSGPGPTFSWPVSVPAGIPSVVPTKRDEAIQENLFQTYGYPVSDTQFQLIERYNHNRFLEQAFDPEKVMWMATAMGGIQANSAANSTANMANNQNINAIDYVRQPLANFTAERGNIWQQIRYELFIPMAVLLLLPGAVLAQVRAIVAQGSPVLGQVNPFEGIIRSIIAIFLIPGSFLVINYGIDVANSLTFTIADEYRRIFGSDMYRDAKCAVRRAFPINNPASNRNAIDNEEVPQIVQHDVWSPYEALSLNMRLIDPCLGIDESRVADEDVRQAKPVNRLLVNSGAAALGLSWNIMCAFQMVFLYYLWCMGPIAAALWVWPIPKLRQAFGSWCEGVIVLCFWALFWNTSIFLMAAFKGVGDSGTVYMSALIFLCTQSVKSAFDFAGLVSAGASGAMSDASKALQSGDPGGAATKALRDVSSGGGGGGGSPPGSAPMSSSGPSDGRPGGSAAALSSSAVSPMGDSGGSMISAGSMSPGSQSVSGSASLAGDSGAGATGTMGSAGTTGTGGADGGATGPGGAVGGVDPGLPPGERGAGDKGGGGDVAAALGGLALGSSKGGGITPPPGEASATYNMNSTRNPIAGDLNRDGNNATLDLNQPDAGRLSPEAALAAGAMFGQAGGPGAQAADALIDKAIAPPGAPGDVDMRGANANPLASDVGLDQMHHGASQRDLLANGIDADLAGHPQAQMARSATEDLMRATGVSEATLTGALNGNQGDVSEIKDKLGMSPMTLDMALHGDPGAATLALAAAGNANPEALQRAAADGNMAAVEALKMAPHTDAALVSQAALNNDPNAAAQLLAHNGEHTQAAMASAHMVGAELKEAGVSPDVFRSALSGDVQAQTQVSDAMGGANFDTIKAGFYGDTQDAATVMASRGQGEIAAMHQQGMTDDQIRQVAMTDGNVSVLAAQSASPETLSRALEGDRGAGQQLQQEIGSNPAVLEAAYRGNEGALNAIQASSGQDARVMAAASHNSQEIMGVLANDPQGVRNALAGSPQEREAAVSRMAHDLGVRPEVLSQAVSGDSLAASTVMARAGQIASSGGENPDVRLTEGQQRLVEGLAAGTGLMVAAATAYSGVVRSDNVTPENRYDAPTLDMAARGSDSAALAVQQSMRNYSNVGEMAQAGHNEARSFMMASSAVTGTASEAMPGNMRPQTSLYEASSSAQATLRDVGVDPRAVVEGVKSGDNRQLEHAARSLGVSPDIVSGALMRGDSGDAATMMAAAGRNQAVQALAQQGDPSAALAVQVAQTQPAGLVDAAMRGDNAAQAHLAQSLASSPEILGQAASNPHAMAAVGMTLGDGARAAVSSANMAQQMVAFHPDSNLVQSAIHGSGAGQSAAIGAIAHDMGVAPAVLRDALSGSNQGLAAMVTASSYGLNHAREAQGGSPYYAELSRAYEQSHPLAQAIDSARHGQPLETLRSAVGGDATSQDAVRSSLAGNSGLVAMQDNGNQYAGAIVSASAASAYAGDTSAAYVQAPGQELGIAANFAMGVAAGAVSNPMSYHAMREAYESPEYQSRMASYNQYSGVSATYADPTPRAGQGHAYYVTGQGDAGYVTPQSTGYSQSGPGEHARTGSEPRQAEPIGKESGHGPWSAPGAPGQPSDAGGMSTQKPPSPPGLETPGSAESQPGPGSGSPQGMAYDGRPEDRAQSQGQPQNQSEGWYEPPPYGGSGGSSLGNTLAGATPSAPQSFGGDAGGGSPDGIIMGGNAGRAPTPQPPAQEPPARGDITPQASRSSVSDAERRRLKNEEEQSIRERLRQMEEQRQEAERYKAEDQARQDAAQAGRERYEEGQKRFRDAQASENDRIRRLESEDNTEEDS